MFTRVLATAGSLRRRMSRPAAWVLTASLAVGMAAAVDVPALAAGNTRPATQDFGDPVDGRATPLLPRGVDQARRAADKPAPKVIWPQAAVAEVAVAAKAGAKPRAAVNGGLPVAAAEATTPAGRAGRSAQDVPARVRVEVLPRAASTKARVDGPIVRVNRADAGAAAPVDLALSYQGFATAYGGDYGARLRLVRLPECALTTPEKPECVVPTPVKATNDSAAGTLTAQVDARAATTGGAVYAMTAGGGSSQGDYSATKLAPSSKWNVTPSSGAFNWSYPLRTPPVPGGQAPGVTLSYSSQTVDGRTSATNNQGSWIGEGFSWEPGYIERRYKACAEDGHDTVGDLCWSHDNATIMLNGSSGELIKDSAGRWRMTSDSDWKIEPLTGATNGDNNGEHWRVTTTDGTEYYFGLNRMPGWTSGKEETASAWTVPVFGDDNLEPCYNATFANAHCNQAWRWNLDYVKDVHDNVASYFYTRESNYYARGAKTDVNGVEYHRAGWLKRIDYGQRHNAVYTTNAPARVQFTTGERCLPGGGVDCDEADLNETTASSWPDVPWDRNCAVNTKCKLDQSSPTFWTRKRLTKITTEIRSGAAWTPVDSWTFDHLLTDNADGSRTLWLNKINHSGHVGGTADVPTVELYGTQLPGRVDSPDDNTAPLNRFRLSAVYTDAGGQIDVNYAPADCDSAHLPQPGASTKRCYPVMWNPLGGEDPVADWFHKYVVAEVLETDRTGGSPKMVTRYEYVGDTAWRKAEPDGLGDPKYLTWSQWRGYEKVRVRRGDGQTMTTLAEHTYLRGMDGNPLPGGGTLTAKVTDSTGAQHVDTDELAGHELESVTYDGAAVVAKTITVPWLHQTGSQTHPWGTRRSVYTKPDTERGFTALAAGGWRETKTVNSYDLTHGRPTTVDDLGDVSTDADDRCVRTTYADSQTRWMYALASQIETVAVKCGTAPDRSKHVISDTRTWYDGLAFGAEPTKGDPTKTEYLASHNGTTATYVTQNDATFDVWGRPLTLKDAAGSTVTTVYTQTDGLTTKKEETGPLGSTYKTTTEYSPAWGVPTGQTDPNGKRSDLGYDPLGRLTAVWLPDRSKSGGLTPSIKYTYTLRTDAPVAVKTERIEIDGSYGVEYQLYDGHLRPRQTQTEGPEGGRLVADSFYTATGQPARTYETYHAAGLPTDQILAVNNGDVGGQTWYEYDGADRVTAEVFGVEGNERWRTTTTYGGDRTSVDPPAGGVPTTTITDARGNTTSLLQHKADGPTGDAHTTTYTYAPSGQLSTVKDEAGNLWEWKYDQRGRVKETIDPDTGKTVNTYDDLNRLASTTDSRNKLLSYTYDKIGRKTAIYDGTVATGTKIAAWTFDTIAKGQLYASIRYVNGKSYGITYPALDDLYRPLRTRYIIPSETGMTELAGTYEFTNSYNRDGTLQGMTMPAAGGLAAEALVFGYDEIQRPTSMTGLNSYVTGTSYAQTGELLQLQLDTGAKKAWLSWNYEEGTKRLNGTSLIRQGTSAVDIDTHYTYDDAGNVKAIADTPVGGARDVQCFDYDDLRRLTQAWATDNDATDPCAGGPSGTGVDGPAPYHHSYTYDSTGNRQVETLHGIGGAADVVRTYTSPNAKQPQPHRLDQVVENTAGGDRLYTYKYDNAGNTTERDLVGQKQTLTWDAEGNLESSSENGQATTYLYTAEGNRFLRKEPGATTVYLPGMELRLNNTTRVVDGTRYYGFNGETVAVRTKAGVNFLASDHHGTSNAVVDATTGAVTHRRTTPFGAVRGTPPASWAGDKGFVGGTQDPSGLTHLGAREYDPSIGRFVSVDPLIDVNDPQQINPYPYSNNNPTTYTDPDGRMLFDDGGGSTNTTPSSNINCYGGNMSASCQDTDDDTTTTDPAVEEAKRNKEKAKQKLIEAGKMLLKIAMDELGITAALDCFTTGDLGACGETALNVASSFVGGLAGKLLGKYGAPWKWKKGAELVKKIWNLLDNLVEGVKDFFKNSKIVQKLTGGCNSFLPGTGVLLADGSSKPIEDVDVGETVLATDPDTGQTAAKTVVGTIIGQGSKNLVEITVDTHEIDAKSTGAVVATDNHPFWVASGKVWTAAKDLQPGQWLRMPSGQEVRIAKVRHWTQTARVHNLTIAEIHTYYVDAGGASILVHNDHVPAPSSLPGFPNAKRVKPKTSVQGGGGMRKRWEDKKHIYEWDSQHGEVEMYNKRGVHLGSFDPETGQPIVNTKGDIKGPVSGRTCKL